MDTNAADLVKTAIDQALAIDRPAERARVITEILKAVDDAKLVAVRKADILKLRETQTLREVAEHVGLSIGRIDQIATGRTTGRRKPAPE
jgi:DNA-directed RNA polymerase sigma subunit (sigma70/sigma32)